MAKHKLLPTKEIFKLYQEGKTLKEIAQEYECSFQNVSYHINKAKKEQSK